jgi:hypothetical protein
VENLLMALHQWTAGEEPDPADAAAWGGHGRSKANGDGSRREASPSPPDVESLIANVWDAGEDDYNIPPREWLLGTAFCRRFLSSLVADGGVGKTALRVAQLISLATDRRLTGEFVFRRSRVLIVSLEDDKEELRRRVYAVMRHHGIDPQELAGWLYLWAPKGLRLVEMKAGNIVAGTLQAALELAIDRFKIDLISLDPFIKSHGLEENSNGAIDYVCTLLAKLAIDKNISIDLPHHTNKGAATAGDANRGRGASAMKDAARLVYTLTPMSSEEAEAFGVTEAERRLLVRMDNGKVNIAPPASEARWFKLTGVDLGNGRGNYPNGDTVQTVQPWQPPDAWAGTNSIVLNRILDEIEKGLDNGPLYSSASAATTRAAWKVVQRSLPEKPEKQCRSIIAAWLKSGTLFLEDYEDPLERKQRLGLRVNAGKRPS